MSFIWDVSLLEKICINTSCLLRSSAATSSKVKGTVLSGSHRDMCGLPNTCRQQHPSTTANSRTGKHIERDINLPYRHRGVSTSNFLNPSEMRGIASLRSNMDAMQAAVIDHQIAIAPPPASLSPSPHQPPRPYDWVSRNACRLITHGHCI